MPIKNLTLGLGLLLFSSTLAAEQHYTVKANSPVSAVAKKFNISVEAVAKANHISPKAIVKAGTVLRIPATSKIVSAPPVATKGLPINVYVVRNGDNDYTIAHKFHLTTPQLHSLNQGVNFAVLKLGQKLIVPASKASAARVAYSMPAKSAVPGKPALASKAKGPAKSGASASAKTMVAKATPKPKPYVVHGGENNWIIAHRLGVKLTELRAVNPGVNLERIHNGQTIFVPARAFLASKSASSNKIGKKISSRYAMIAGDNVNIRRSPSTKSETVTTVDEGLRVVVLDRDGSWYKLRFPKGSIGWVRSDFLKAASKPQETPRYATRSRRATEPRLTYAKRSRSGRHSSGSLATINDSGSDVISTANTFLGVRYSYGSASRSATDCSGFVKQVYQSKGVKLPRTSREMSGVGASVSKGELKPGDLVFFHTRNSRGINHVGIYAGNGKFIHASSGGGRVQVNNLTDGYYSQRFAGAKRVAKSKKSSTKAVVQAERSKDTNSQPTTDKSQDN